MNDIAAHLRAAWTRCEIASSRTASLREFVEELISLVPHRKRLYGSSHPGLITFALGNSDQLEVEFPISNSRGQFRSMIACLLTIASEKGAANINPYGGRICFSFLGNDKATLNIHIEFSNTIRNSYFCITLIE